MRFAQAHAAVKKQRIIGFPRGFSHGFGGREGKVVVVAHHERLKGVLGVEVWLAIPGDPISGDHGFQLRSRNYRWGGRGQRSRSRRRLELNLQLPTRGNAHRILQKTQIIVLEPDLAKFIRRFQRDLVGINRTRAQRRKPHVVGVGTQLGTKMFLR